MILWKEKKNIFQSSKFNTRFNNGIKDISYKVGPIQNKETEICPSTSKTTKINLKG